MNSNKIKNNNNNVYNTINTNSKDKLNSPKRKFYSIKSSSNLNQNSLINIQTPQTELKPKSNSFIIHKNFSISQTNFNSDKKIKKKYNFNLKVNKNEKQFKKNINNNINNILNPTENLIENFYTNYNNNNNKNYDDVITFSKKDRENQENKRKLIKEDLEKIQKTQNNNLKNYKDNIISSYSVRKEYDKELKNL